MKTTGTLAAVLFLALSATAAVQAQERPTLTPDDYDQWERLGGATLSPNGEWMAVSIGRVSDEGELRIHHTSSDSVVVVPFGTSATFSGDNRWVAYSIGVSEEEREAAEEADREAYNKLGLLNLQTGEQTARDNFQSFTFSDDGRYLALRRYKPKDKESDGVDVVIHDLTSGSDMSFGNISEMEWQEDGALIALTTDADEQVGNGVTVYDPSSGRIRSLDTDRATYRQLSWREESADLVVYKTFEDEAFEDTAHVAMVWRDLDENAPLSFTLDPQIDSYFPSSMRVVEFRAPLLVRRRSHSLRRHSGTPSGPTHMRGQRRRSRYRYRPRRRGLRRRRRHAGGRDLAHAGCRPGSRTARS